MSYRRVRFILGSVIALLFFLNVHSVYSVDYTTWATTENISSATQDDDADDIPNLLEYVFHTDPHTFDDPVFSVAQGSPITLEWQQRSQISTDVSVSVMVSTNLLNWAPLTINPADRTNMALNAETNKVSVKITQTSEKLFYRVRAVLTPTTTTVTGLYIERGNELNRLYWDPVVGATSYTVYWGTSPGVTTGSSTVADISSPFEHRLLDNGTVYYYTVTATVGGVETALSQEISIDPISMGPLENALFDGVNPLREKLLPPSYANRIHHAGYHCWDPSLTKVGNTYHLVYSRWTTKADMTDISNWQVDSEIVHATSSNLTGPYVEQEVVAHGGQTGAFYSGGSVVNSKLGRIYKTDGSVDKYVLYFIGHAKGTGMLFSNDLSTGSWSTPSSVSDAPFNNPSLLFFPNQSAYAFHKGYYHLQVYTSTNYQASAGAGWNGWTQVLDHEENGENHLPAGIELEDPTLWQSKDEFHTILTDHGGKLDNLSKAHMHYYTDAWDPITKTGGSDYTLFSNIPVWATYTPIIFDDGTIVDYSRQERPEVYVNPTTGKVEAYLMTCSPATASAADGSTIVIFPIEGGSWEPDPNEVVDKKLLVQYKMDQISGTQIQDESGNNHTATLHGGSWRTISNHPNGQTTALDLENGWVELPSGSLSDLWGYQTTITFWASNPDGTTMNDACLIDASRSDGKRQIKTTMTSNLGRLTWSAGIHVDETQFPNLQPIYSDGNNDLNDWNHWALIKDGPTYKYRIYKNGVLVKDSFYAFGYRKRLLNDITTCALGKDLQTGATGTFPGLITDFCVYGRVLTQQEIVQSMTGGTASPPKASLVTDKTSGALPLAVRFDAQSSRRGSSNIIEYKWDFDGDGVWDATTTSPTTSHTYSTVFSGAPKLQITDANGLTSTAQGATITAGTMSVSGLVAKWDFEDANTTGQATDASGNGNHATYYNAPVLEASMTNYGQAVHLEESFTSANGLDQYVRIDKTAFMNTPNTYSVCFWLNPNYITNYNLNLYANSVWQNCFTFQGSSGGVVYTGVNTTDRMTLPGNTVLLNQWQHFVYTFDNGTGIFYKDGVEVGRHTGAPNQANNWNSFNMGRIKQGNNRTIRGLLDDVRIYNHALTPTEVGFVMSTP